ncbi:Dam family site-specific DNA-(adenine-N6)-methyltransferase [Microbacterium sp. M3]|uniref:Site-specific DNA-methyltransferase (adenine-specific) n=1 Tax=Microbacterium arthrosphaerae TaxID=792652 RepID=A0ABU4GWM3_9MICO|nr:MULTISPECIES: Dam family site-specific DNA-(adenine-N6)-methyltransferase [Microbacterium]MDW4571410.1 Dam family site-specific DNA-(adenine-N6)-methyltransferase [Microbacterium arthrosphaerae]MDW7605265.1 Dam family site-specific DNA-(adenine-N6)-methyltransferase [Microbacterium sp. M3]
MSEAPTRRTAQPFISWAGSKRKLLEQIKPHLPSSFDRYFEPFLGGGSLFLHLRPSSAYLNDACLPLVDTWRAVKRNPMGVHREATRRPLDKVSYYEARAERGGGYLQRSGRFIYLNKGAFNGLYRVNLRGEFNVPWGAPKSGFICDLENLEEVSRTLNDADATITHGDFADVLARSSRGDLAFIDPPYVTSHNNNGFIAYNEKIFSWSDQERLAAAARAAVSRGSYVLVTNAHHDSVTALYPDFETIVLERSSTLAASKEKRGRTSEVLMIGRP